MSKFTLYYDGDYFDDYDSLQEVKNVVLAHYYDWKKDMEQFPEFHDPDEEFGFDFYEVKETISIYWEKELEDRA